MDIDEYIKGFNMSDSKKSSWAQMIKPPKVIIILGKRGSGKTALGMYLLETLAKEYNLLPIVINFPRSKQELLPPNFIIKSLDEVKTSDNSVILIDEGSTLIPAGKAKLEETIKAFMALSRQREQVIILIFHASADVGARILRGVDTLIFKEPSLRQIQWGSKDDYFHQLLLEAKEKLANRGTQYCYIDSEDPEFRGASENPLPSFWSDSVSKAWAGVSDIWSGSSNSLQPSLEPTERTGWIPLPSGQYQKGDDGQYFIVTPEMKARKVIVERHNFKKSFYITYRDPISNIHWIQQV